MDQYLDSTQKKRLYGVVMAVVVLLAVFLGVKSLSAIKELAYIGKGVYPSNVISVNGKGEVMAKPDIATFSFSIMESSKTVKAAQDLAAAKENSVLAALKALGIEEKDIQTSGYNSYPKYEYQTSQGTICAGGYCPPPGKQVLTGYEVDETITVKVRNTDKAGDVLIKVGELGVSNISGLSFTVDDVDALKIQARDKAIADAKAKASTLSKSVKVKLKKVVNFYENGDQPIPMYAGYDVAGMAQPAVMQSKAAPSLPTGENKITSSVTIVYEIE